MRDIGRTEAELDDYRDRGMCPGSRYLPRAFAENSTRGVCVACGTHQPIERRDEHYVVREHKAPRSGG